MISHTQLNECFVSPRMRAYFHKKLPELTPEEINLRVEELLKYLNMAVYSEGDIPFNDEIDEIWHLWILETQEYAKLCTKLHGGQFMHHSSSAYMSFDTENNANSRDGNFQRAIEILMSYVLNYGDFENERVKYWPVAEKLCQHFDGDISKLNAWLRTKLQQCMEDAV